MLRWLCWCLQMAIQAKTWTMKGRFCCATILQQVEGFGGGKYASLRVRLGENRHWNGFRALGFVGNMVEFGVFRLPQADVVVFPPS